MERICLQAAIIFCALVLLAVGLSGVLLGSKFLHSGESLSADHFFRFLSAIAAGMGVMYITTVPRIEIHGERMATLSFLIVVGGLAHLYGFFLRPTPTFGTLIALVMELIVVPLVWLGQRHVAHKAARTAQLAPA